jgi:hypothetical protein
VWKICYGLWYPYIFLAIYLNTAVDLKCRAHLTGIFLKVGNAFVAGSISVVIFSLIEFYEGDLSSLGASITTLRNRC